MGGSGLEAGAAVDACSDDEPDGLEGPSRASPHAPDVPDQLSLTLTSPHGGAHDRLSEGAPERGTAQKAASRNQRKARKTSGDDKKRRESASAAVSANIASIGNLDSLLDLCHSLLSLGSGLGGVSHRQGSAPCDYEQAKEKDIVDYLTQLKGHFDRLRTSKQFSICLDRFYVAQVADLYHRMKRAKNFQGSLAVVFAKTIIPDDVRRLHELSNRRIQMLWERYMRVARPWYSLVKRFGSGALPMIPRELKNEQ